MLVQMKLWVVKRMSVWQCPKKSGEMHLMGKARPGQEEGEPHLFTLQSSDWSLVLGDPSLRESLAIS